MKKLFALVMALAMMVTTCACGSGGTAESDTASAKGYTIKVVAVHKTLDSNGAPLAAVEMEFTNENSEPASFLAAGQVTIFQNGKQMMPGELFLDNNYDWDSYYTEIKDGATITVFSPQPLDNADDPVEVKIDVMDPSTYKSIASAQSTFDLTD